MITVGALKADCAVKEACSADPNLTPKDEEKVTGSGPESCRHNSTHGRSAVREKALNSGGKEQGLWKDHQERRESQR